MHIRDFQNTLQEQQGLREKGTEGERKSGKLGKAGKRNGPRLSESSEGKAGRGSRGRRLEGLRSKVSHPKKAQKRFSKHFTGAAGTEGERDGGRKEKREIGKARKRDGPKLSEGALSVTRRPIISAR